MSHSLDVLTLCRFGNVIFASSGANLDPSPSERNVTQGKDLGLVAEKSRPIVNNALTNGIEVSDFSGAVVGEKLLQTADVILSLLLVVVLSCPELEQDLIICPVEAVSAHLEPRRCFALWIDFISHLGVDLLTGSLHGFKMLVVAFVASRTTLCAQLVGTQLLLHINLIAVC